jgi:Plasmid pRiA4b ORF-3-like protein
MAIYRFRVSFEDYDDIMRDIDIRSNQTFEDLHNAIHSTTGYAPEKSSSFYVSNDQWIKGNEIAYLPYQKKLDAGISLMNNSKLSNYIDDPHQKFYYTYNFDRPYDFHVELVKILLDPEKGKEYPSVFRSSGEAPKPLGVTVAAASSAISDDFDFLNDMEYAPEDPDEMESLGSIEGEHVDAVEEEDEKDEFADEFSDGDNSEAEDFSKEEDY